MSNTAVASSVLSNVSSHLILKEEGRALPQTVQYTVFIMTMNGTKSYDINYSGDIDGLSRKSLVELSGFTGDTDEIINVMAAESEEVTANTHFQIQVLTDNPDQPSQIIDVQSDLNLETFEPSQLQRFIDADTLNDEIFHICCKKQLS